MLGAFGPEHAGSDRYRPASQPSAGSAVTGRMSCRPASIPEPFIVPGPDRLTRAMRSPSPQCQQQPSWALACRASGPAGRTSPRYPILADTDAKGRTGIYPVPMLTTRRAASEPGFALRRGDSDIVRNTVRAAGPAYGPGRRAWRHYNGNAHAYRCAPPGRNPGGGAQGQPY